MTPETLIETVAPEDLNQRDNLFGVTTDYGGQQFIILQRLPQSLALAVPVNGNAFPVAVQLIPISI